MKNEKYFFKKTYNGADHDQEFFIDFSEYLQDILETQRWDSMNEGQLYLQGGKKAIEEVLDIIKEQIRT